MTSNIIKHVSRDLRDNYFFWAAGKETYRMGNEEGATTAKNPVNGRAWGPRALRRHLVGFFLHLAALQLTDVVRCQASGDGRRGGGGCVDDGLEIRYGWNGPTCDLLSSSSRILLASGKKTATKSKRYKKHLSDALILVLRVVIGNPSMWPMACGQGKRGYSRWLQINNNR